MNLSETSFVVRSSMADFRARGGLSLALWSDRKTGVCCRARTLDEAARAGIGGSCGTAPGHRDGPCGRTGRGGDARRTNTLE